MKTVSEVTFFEAPKVDYSIIGNDIKTGIIGLTRSNDGKKFVMHDAFMPSDCNCSYITYTYRNPFTGEVLQANAAIDGLQKIIKGFKTDLYAISAAVDKKDVTAALKAHTLATKDLVTFIKSL